MKLKNLSRKEFKILLIPNYDAVILVSSVRKIQLFCRKICYCLSQFTWE